MARLLIQHLRENQFEVMQLATGKRSQLIKVPSPYEQTVKDRPYDNLMSRLQWYLEEFLQYPFSPSTEQAQNVEEALKAWGENAFNAVFNAGNPRDWMTSAKQNAVKEGLTIFISSDSPEILSWPWEALIDPESGGLGHQFRMERRLNINLGNPPALSEKLPKDQINILLVTARPYESDVQYRSVSRRLVDLANGSGLPINIEILRPPTFDTLRRRLTEQRDFFHIVHFDSHGSFGVSSGESRPEMFKGPEGYLVFEDAESRPDLVRSDKLSQLLRDCSVPMVVLNACRSAMQKDGTDNPYSSVAASLLKSGIRSVVAMAYSVYVTGVQEFVPAFYRELFYSGNGAEAVRKGRQEMFAHGNRTPINPEVSLQDWMVPVIYQQEELGLSFAAANPDIVNRKPTRLPEEARLDKEFYEFVGRDRAFLALERALRRPPPAILIHGVGGIGKTTLTRAFIKWLEDTSGLGLGCLWFSFNEIHSATFVINSIGRSFVGPNFGTGDSTVEMAQLISFLRTNRIIIIWDNFESVWGIEGTEAFGLLPLSDRNLLQQLLYQIRGGKSKVIVTSRSEENWLGPQLCYSIQLAGF